MRYFTFLLVLIAASTLAFCQQPTKPSTKSSPENAVIIRSDGFGDRGGGWASPNPPQQEAPEYAYTAEVQLGKKTYTVKLNCVNANAVSVQSFENGKLFVHVSLLAMARTDGLLMLDYVVHVGGAPASAPKTYGYFPPLPNSKTLLYASGHANVVPGKRKLVTECTSSDAKSPKRKVFVTVSPIKSQK